MPHLPRKLDMIIRSGTGQVMTQTFNKRKLSSCWSMYIVYMIYIIYDICVYIYDINMMYIYIYYLYDTYIWKKTKTCLGLDINIIIIGINTHLLTFLLFNGFLEADGMNWDSIMQTCTHTSLGMFAQKKFSKLCVLVQVTGDWAQSDKAAQVFIAWTIRSWRNMQLRIGHVSAAWRAKTRSPISASKQSYSRNSSGWFCIPELSLMPNSI